MLVPEIALTPQTIDRFAARFPGKVAVLHSQLTLGEQFDEWRRIKHGEFDVVIGARSALFAPQPDLGLIVIDEEHEWTYKQADTAPRYRARDVAVKLAEADRRHRRPRQRHTGRRDLFPGRSAASTASSNCRSGSTPVVSAPLPKVQVVDMREELKAGNRDLFSRALSRRWRRRSGRESRSSSSSTGGAAATFVQCRQCGLVMRCRRCDIALTFHAASNSLVCHQCNYRAARPGRVSSLPQPAHQVPWRRHRAGRRGGRAAAAAGAPAALGQ